MGLIRCKCGRKMFAPEGTPCLCSFVTTPTKARQPFYITMLTMLREEGDKGPGDTAQRILAEIGGERFKTLAKQLGIPCGCTRRQAEWNQRWPY